MRRTNRAIIRVAVLASLILLTGMSDARTTWVSAGQTPPPTDTKVAPTSAPLPGGVKVGWDQEKAFREKTSTRERICLNGLWRWQPADQRAATVPPGAWGYFKVPGFWPGRGNYLQEDCQTLYPHPTWSNADLRGITSAWYQREIAVPKAWDGRHITLEAAYVNSFAIAFVDGKKVGELRF